MLNKQEVFDSVVSFYRNGGLPGYGSHQCAYLGEDGGRCAVGALLHNLGVSDEDILEVNDETVETLLDDGGDMGDVIRAGCKEEVWASKDGRPFLHRLQSAHDGVADGADAGMPGEWAKDIKEMLLTRFAEFASEEELNFQE